MAKNTTKTAPKTAKTAKTVPAAPKAGSVGPSPAFAPVPLEASPAAIAGPDLPGRRQPVHAGHYQPETWSDFFMGRHFLSLFVPPALLACDMVLCVYILSQVPYTEIDWRAYMQQVAQILAGERDYTKIAGDTGPLVYPAAHVYGYTAFYLLTKQGTNILLAQFIFFWAYLATLALVMFCYWRAGAPTYVFPMLVLSKRLHSIFLLRCFNDGIAVFCLWLAIFCFQCRHWSLGVLVFAWGLGTKMTLLLALPAIAVVLLVGRGFRGSLALAALLGLVQLGLGLPFLAANPAGYLGRAFELSRQFLYKWTVNWRFVDESTFLGTPFAAGLLALHAALLACFATRQWLRPFARSFRHFAPLANAWGVAKPMLGLQPPLGADDALLLSARAARPRYITTAILTSVVAGMLTARSLHYQFFVYLGWSTPFLLWRSGAHPAVQYALWGAQEWAWNVFPSTPASSAVAVAVMAVVLAFVLLGNQDEFQPALPPLSAGNSKTKESKKTA